MRDYTRFSIHVACICLFLAVVIPSDAAAGFSKEMSIGRGQCIIQTQENDYLFAGRLYFSGSSNIDSLLVKLDEQGKVLWKRRFRGPTISDGSEMVLRAIAQVSGGYIAVGYITSFNGDIVLIKVDQNGKLLWSKTLISPSGDLNFADGGSITATSDGGFAITATWGDYTDDFNEPVILIKFNSSGEMLWNKTYGFAGRANFIAQTSDGHLLIAAGPAFFSPLFSGDSTTFMVLKLSSSGAVSWKKFVKLNGLHTLQSFALLNDSGSALVASGSNYVSVIRLNSNGSLNWSKAITHNTFGPTITQLSDGNLVIASTDQTLGLLMKLDLAGNIVLQHDFSKRGPKFYQPYSIIATRDRGMAVTGSLRLPTREGVFVMKFDSEGETGICGTFTNTNYTLRNFKVRLTSEPMVIETQEVVISAEKIQSSATVPNVTNFCP